MIHQCTQKEHEDRATLRDLYGDAINFAQLVRQQTTLTKDQREAVQWSLVAMLKARRELMGEPAPMPHEALLAAMEE